MIIYADVSNSGKRYKCKDCKEKIGFDLFEACYSLTSKLPGRFNQQQTPDHKLELEESYIFARMKALSADVVFRNHYSSSTIVLIVNVILIT